MSASLKGSLVLFACSLSLVATAAPQHGQPPRPVQPPPHRPATSRHVAPPTTAPAHVVAATQPRFEAPEEPPLLIPKDPAEALAAAREARAEKPADAYRIYKHLVKTAPLSDEGQAASKEAAAMEKDPVVSKKVMDARAESKAAAALSMADNFLAAGLVDKAKQRYQSVITEYPDTMCATVAKERLAKAATVPPAPAADPAK